MSITEKRALAAVLDDREVVAGFSRLAISVIITNPLAPDNPIVYVNDAFERTTGYSRSAVVGRNCRFLQGERTAKSDVDKVRDAVEGGRDVTVDILNYRASGEPFTNRLTIAPIHDQDGKPIYFLGLQKEIRTNDSGRGTLDHNLEVIRSRVHTDLAMILTTIGAADHSGTLEDPMREVEALPRRLECLQLVYEELRLTDDHVDWLGIDLGALLGRIASTVAHHEGRPGIRFGQRIDPADVTLEVATRVALLVSEALSNAFSHAFVGHDRGTVDLRVSRLSEGGLRILVADDGVGIPRNIDWPSERTRGGRLTASLLEGLDATINVARGAAGTVVMIDVPVDPHDLTSQGE
ncbi:Blue-light-activated histidine kinase 2 [Roseivivax jejudonensis]|uniref:Blue-light-activated histidine kinase 2 n=1 Tax=Roseivivax jejudonensis TaxID=1529041 RepID=A0A1X6ZF79_9RHOB|nr:PAS domain-containing protein [Roseivivax jejudonensis]SLN49967.1 Blue-light-activated histidine kinase 2 [Roseivivax jejudonensis]